jgi:hypothetical protein
VNDDQEERAINPIQRSRAVVPPWGKATAACASAVLSHSVSCVVLAHDDGPRLALLLPALGGVLGESVHRWEVITVDATSTDGSESLLAQWDETPGYRSIRMALPAWTSNAIETGLKIARGEAVILIEARSTHPPAIIGEMLGIWSRAARNRIVYAEHAAGSGESRVRNWLEADPANGEAVMSLTELVLFDRSIVTLLLLQYTRKRWLMN